MTWNYRIVKTAFEQGDRYAIHEVYYDAHGNPTSRTAEPCCPIGETLEELRAEMERYQKAMEKPVLIGNDYSIEQAEL